MCTRAELQRDRTRGSQAGASFLQPAEGGNKESTAGKAACPKTCLLRLCGPGLFSRTRPEVKVALPGPVVAYPPAGRAGQCLASSMLTCLDQSFQGGQTQITLRNDCL